MINNLPKNITVEDMFKKYCEFVAENVECSDLKIITDDIPAYEDIEVCYEILEDERRGCYFDYAILTFYCKEDEKLLFKVRLSKMKENNYWNLNFDKNPDIKSLRHLNAFEIYLIQLEQNYSHITFTENEGCEDVTPEQKPELSYS